MLSVWEAQIKIASQAVPIQDTDRVEGVNALDRFAAHSCYALTDVPPADNSAMDGFAFKRPALSTSTTTSSPSPPCTFPISQVIHAGQAPMPLIPATAARILTGAPIPEGADTVVIQENCDYDATQVTLLEMPPMGANIRPKGQDIQTGRPILHRGERINVLSLTQMSATGIAAFDVIRKPKIALFSTGDELVPPGTPLKAGQIYNSNLILLTGLLQAWGCEVIVSHTLPDQLKATVGALKQAAEVADVIITTGGVSVGDADFLRDAIAQIGHLDVWKINIKPGKPMAFGHIHQAATPVPIFALPGNPVSCWVTCVLFVKHFIGGLMARPYCPPYFQHAPASFDLDKPQTRGQFLRAKLINHELQVFPNQSSALLSSLNWANALIWVEPNRCISTGDSIPFLTFNELLTFN